MTVKLRMFGQDLASMAAKARNKYDEAWMGFIRFGLVIFYDLVFFGPFFWIKNWGNMGITYGANLASVGLLIPSIEGFTNWLMWVAIVSGVTLVGYPAVFYIFSWFAKKIAGDKEHSAKQLFLSFSYALSPYALLLWIAFSITLVAVNWAYPLTAFSDPFGWGWNLLGTKYDWNPMMPQILPYIQAPILFAGLALALNSTYNIAMKLFDDHTKAFRASAVMGVLHTLAALGFIMILFG